MHFSGTAVGMKHAAPDGMSLRNTFFLFVTATSLALGGCAAEAEGDATSDDLMGSDAEAFIQAKAELRDVRAALEETDADDARLASVLRKVGPALTEAQQGAYIRAFYSQPTVRANRATLNAQAAEAERAVRGLVQNAILFERIMSGRNSARETVQARPTDLYDAFKTLAATHSSASACAFGNAIISGSPGYEALANKREDVIGDIIVPGCTRIAIESMGKGENVSVSLGDFTELGGSVAAAAQEVRAALAAPKVEIEAPGPLGRFHAALTAAYVIYSAGIEGTSGKYHEALRSLLVSSPDVIQGTSDAISLYRTVVRGGLPLADISRFTGALSGGILVLTSALAIAQDLEDLDDTSDKMRLAADCISLAGGLLVLAGAAPAAAVVLALAASINFAAKMIQARALSRAERTDRETLLPRLGLRPNVLRVLLNPNEAALGSLAGAGMTPADLQSLIEASPELLAPDTYRFDAFANLARGLRWNSATILGLFRSMLNYSVAPVRQAFYPVFWVEQGILKFTPGRNRTEVLADIDAFLVNPNEPDQHYQRAVRTFRSWVATH